MRAQKPEKRSLAVPEVNAVEEAGSLLSDLPRLWAEATQEERRKLLLAMLEAVYVDTKDSRGIVLIRPKAAFRTLFEVTGVETVTSGLPSLAADLAAVTANT